MSVPVEEVDVRTSSIPVPMEVVVIPTSGVVPTEVVRLRMEGGGGGGWRMVSWGGGGGVKLEDEVEVMGEYSRIGTPVRRGVNLLIRSPNSS